jgi:nitrite reductase/ring-hydroxylating ferredoxin subunit/DMSO/TMAO reductase YedYZ heme-binding membrane subunit
MSVAYRAVNWNRQKRIYDLVLGIGAPGLVAVFAAITLVRHPTATAETALIRGLAVAAVLLLHLILCIGPLCRLSPAFLPLLYNRRHLGVAMCLLAAGHAGFAIFQYHALGDLNPFVSLLSGNQALDSVAGFPFELLGLAGLLILVLMAATSHDFWLSVLTPPVWKRLHMLVYAAYALVLAHVALGPLQAEGGLPVAAALALGAILVIGLHVAAGSREVTLDRDRLLRDGWVDVCAVDEIAENRAKIGLVAGERVAVFRYQGMISAVSNVCRHQNGPLGEGKIIDGCITCPWHGYQYRPDTGSSPPPFSDTIPTFRVRVVEGRALVHSQPLAPGTFVEPAVIASSAAGSGDAAEFYVGYQPQSPPALAGHTRRAVVTVTFLLVGTVAVLALAQSPFASATFEFGREREVTGRLLLRPYPAILVDAVSGVPPLASRHWLLGAPGKHGADVDAREGQRVRILGALIHRGNAAMLEIAGIDTLADSGSAASPPHMDLGVFTLAGEIVDSKCWLGVMNPGEGKTHLACAVRCVSGGLPPMLVIRDEEGRERQLLLADSRGGPLDARILPAVGRPVRVTGRVAREGELLFLRADPGAYQVLH